MRVREVRGLASPVASSAGLEGLAELVEAADAVHLHNVMNPTVLERVVPTGKATAWVQDHRVLCPGPGLTLPDGVACSEPFSGETCAGCLPDEAYRERLVERTERRRRALLGARVVVLSEYMREACKRAGLGPVHVLPPWVEARAEPSEVGEGAVLAGRLVAHKDPLVAWRAWQRAGGRLRVCGVGGLKEQLEGAEHLGWVSRRVLREVLAASRVLLFPARWQEPFGIVGVEALAVGTPVIAMPRGGVPEWAEAGVIRVEDEDQMAEALGRLRADPALCGRLGREGWEHVRERFGREALWPRYEALLTSPLRGD